jgi:hypothetical protein
MFYTKYVTYEKTSHNEYEYNERYNYNNCEKKHLLPFLISFQQKNGELIMNIHSASNDHKCVAKGNSVVCNTCAEC